MRALAELLARPPWGASAEMTDQETKAELRELQIRVDGIEANILTRLLAVKAEIQSLKDTLNELQQSRDDDRKTPTERLKPSPDGST